MGAMIAMACDRIYIAPNGKIGALTGWIPGPDGMPVKLPDDVAEKFLSAERAEVRALTKQKGYPPAIAMAMVDREFSAPGAVVDVLVRESRQPARVTPLPFYRRSSADASGSNHQRT